MCVRCRLLLHVPRVCRLDMTVSCAKMAEPIMMLFGLWTWLGPRNHVGAWILPGEWTILWGTPCNVAFRRNSLMTCRNVWQYYDTLSEALSVVDEEAMSNAVILVHTGAYHDESLFMDYTATVLGAGTCHHCWFSGYPQVLESPWI